MTRIGLLILLLGVSACAPATSPGAASKPNPVPVIEEIRMLPGRGVAVEGRGSARTIEIAPDPAGIGLGIFLLSLTHSGQSTFIVSTLQGAQAEVAAQAIGPYRGRHPLVVHDAVTFEVVADGDWSISVQPMPRGGQPAFSGTGDDVSAYFDPPPPGSWTISHGGQSDFVAHAHCLGGSAIVAERQGAMQETVPVEFGRGPCFWEVRADGDFHLTPRP